MSKLKSYNDELLQKIDSVRKANKIKPSGLNTAATQKQTYYVNTSMGVKGDIIEILKDTTYSDSLKYNDLTTIQYSIGKDSVNIQLKLENTQYLFIYSTKQYKNDKNFIKRLLTLDFKKVYRYKYNIVNTNDLLKVSDVRIVETNKY